MSISKKINARTAQAWIALISLIIAISSCEWGAQLESLRTDNEALKKQGQGLQSQIESMSQEINTLWHNIRCSNPKVADFMKEIDVQCNGDQCGMRTLEQVMNFMITEDHVLIRLRYGAEPSSLAPARKGQLMQMLDPKRMTSVSRILFMVLPSGDAVENKDEAMRGARLLKRYIREELKLGGSAPMQGPLSVTCKNKSQLMELYSRKVAQDKPVPEEPKPRAPQVAIWVFKVDC